MAAKRKPLAEEFATLLKRKPKSIRETIFKVRQILLDKKRWVKDEDFVLANGEHCDSHEAVRCCMMGALKLVDGPFEEKAQDRILKIIERDWTGKRDVDSIEAFNDDPKTRHRDVLDVLNNAFEVR